MIGMMLLGDMKRSIVFLASNPVFLAGSVDPGKEIIRTHIPQVASIL